VVEEDQAVVEGQAKRLEEVAALDVKAPVEAVHSSRDLCF
jgi:hypothetical protein